ncbi:hypothetical protein RE6C_04411 [Rhodopirellula europaea 6C]|uniref:Uncharacterized protein n=1 Tax=Rhodopirellula europaea 6C TaxID=1263867 RepID=M2AZ71_9BACT|nr:hypothetical protein RE6C_04411 [Rhodopirellula europaea 6C]
MPFDPAFNSLIAEDDGFAGTGCSSKQASRLVDCGLAAIVLSAHPESPLETSLATRSTDLPKTGKSRAAWHRAEPFPTGGGSSRLGSSNDWSKPELTRICNPGM